MDSRKLGRLAPSAEQRARTLPFDNYRTKALPPAPPSCSNSLGAAIAMWLNDTYGCCTVAALANYRAIIAKKYGLGVPGTTNDKVKSTYFGLTGGQDTGLVEHDVLNAGLKGLDLGGDPYMIATWVTVDMTDLATVKSLINLFGALYLGVALPTDAQTQQVWAPTSGKGGTPNSWGMHALLVSDYTPTSFGLVTWGKIQTCTPDWVNEYVVEGHLLLDAEMAAVAGVNWDALVEDTKEVSK